MKKNPASASEQKKTGGISTKSIMIPAVILIFCLHILIAFNMTRINRFGLLIAADTQSLFACSQASDALESAADALADKAALFVSTGDETYLAGYFSELETLEHWSSSFSQSVGQSGNERALAQLDVVSALLQNRRQLEFRALRLCAEALGSDLTNYPLVSGAELPPDASSLTAEAKLDAASRLLSSTEYLQSQNELHAGIGRAVQAASEEAAANIAQKSASLGRYRALQWVITIAIVLLLAVTCVLLTLYLVIPLRASSERVQRGEQLPTGKGLSEFRRLAESYNELLLRWQMMESYLRRQSQTDTLTGLPNRLAFQNLITQLSWEKVHSPVAVFSLDVNGLKETNDSKGHSYGDALLRNCAAYIQAALGGKEGRQCFRFGGDEFAAFWTGVREEDVREAIERFRAEQDSRGVSISIGAAYTKDLSETSVEDLMEQADKNMYGDKSNYHHLHPHAQQ